MHLLTVERMKLFSTRSPWACALLAIALTALTAALVVSGSTESSLPPTVASTQFGYRLGLVVVLALAVLAVTTEYRTGTIQTTFQAVPKRTPALLAKAAVVAGFAFLIGEAAAFGGWGVSRIIAPGTDLALDSTTDWIIVAGTGVVYALAAVAAVGVGLLIRHGAGGLALVITYTLAVEDLVTLIPHAGNQIHRWLPLNVVTKFLSDTGQASGGRDGGNANVLSDSPLNPGWALAYFATFAALVLTAGVTMAKRRDA